MSSYCPKCGVLTVISTTTEPILCALCENEYMKDLLQWFAKRLSDTITMSDMSNDCEVRYAKCMNKLQPHEWQPGDEGWFWIFNKNPAFRLPRDILPAYVLADGAIAGKEEWATVQYWMAQGDKFYRAVLPEVVTNAIS